MSRVTLLEDKKKKKKKKNESRKIKNILSREEFAQNNEQITLNQKLNKIRKNYNYCFRCRSIRFLLSKCENKLRKRGCANVFFDKFKNVKKKKK